VEKGIVMDTLSAELIMRKHKVHENIIAQMVASEAALPPDGMLNDWGPAPAIAGLTAAESELLVIRMLERLASQFGVVFDDEDLPELAGLPRADELLSKVSNRHIADLLRAQCSLLKQPDQRRHERV
jgi:hypothetical protein